MGIVQGLFLFYIFVRIKTNQVFKYKQFTIRDENSAMKVGTDGTLLGCWVDISKAKRVLDIGAGTGVIGIMCAQKNDICQITSLEIDDNAIVDAKFNIASLPASWSNRVNLIHSSLQDYMPNQMIDAMVSNPPFFEKSQENLDESRSKARHTSSLHYTQIFEFAEKYLSEKGTLSMILPVENGKEAIEVCGNYHLNLHKVCEVKPVPSKPPHRLLLTFGRELLLVKESHLTIETGIKRHEYTKDYIELGKEFYLYF